MEHVTNEAYLGYLRGAVAGLSVWIAASAFAADGIAYVSNQKGNVLVIDLATLEPVGEIDIGGGGSRGLGVSTDGKLLAVAVREKGDLAIVDTARRQVLARVPIGKNPEFVRVRGGKAFVSFEPASDGGPPPKPGSAEEREQAEKRKLDRPERAQVAVVDLQRARVEKRIEGGMETEGIEFSRDGKQIMVTNEADDSVTVHDIKTGKLLKTIDVRPYGHRPRGIKLAPDGKLIVVTLEHGNKLVAFDQQFRFVHVASTGDLPYGVSFDRSAERILVATAKGKTLQSFDSRSFEKVGEYDIGDRCWHFTFTSDYSHLLLACGRSAEILILDGHSGHIVKRITNQATPWGIVTFPKALGSLDAP